MGIALRADGRTVAERVRLWCRMEGVFSLYNGLVASVISTMLDDLADYTLTVAIESSSLARGMDAADKLLLKACSSSCTSLVTSLLGIVSAIQRCQSECPGLPEPTPIGDTIKG